MSHKHFINDPEKLVSDALEALTFSNPTLQYLKSEKAIITTANNPFTNVSLMSGGGAGHEPSHAAYVGSKMLTAAISGSIFASPSVSQIHNTITHVSSTAGTLLIVKNYTGDIFNFSLAASKASAGGLPTDFVVVADDVSVGREKGGRVGRRGLAGTVLVHKIAGAYAAGEERPGLEKVKAVAQQVADGLVTAGVSLDHVHVPGRRRDPADFLGEDELEIGMGIHNEPGTRKVSPVPDLTTVVAELLQMLLDPRDKDRAYVDFQAKNSEKVVLMVNNLGGLSVLELSAIAGEVFKQLDTTYNVTPVRSYVGTYMTSLNGPGFSITLLRATDQMLDLLDVEVETAGWSPNTIRPANKSSGRVVPKDQRVIEAVGAANDSATKPSSSNEQWRNPEVVQTIHKALKSGCARVIKAEPTITDYDTLVGDGDCGTTLKRGAEVITAYLNNPNTPSDPVTNLIDIAALIEDNMDGTSGAITAIYVNSLATALHTLSKSPSSSSSSSKSPLGPETWASAAQTALSKLESVTPARPGDRTLMDALGPFVETLADTKDVKRAAEAARRGADGTKGMRARLGRSVYVDEGAYGKVPDPGAVGFAEFLEGIAEGL